MRLRLAYGLDGLEVELPDHGVTVIAPISVPALPDPHAALAAALRSPIAGPPLRSIAGRGRTVAISVCDITRPQPRRAMLAALLEAMPEIRPEGVTILVATGTHRENTPAELERFKASPELLPEGWNLAGAKIFERDQAAE